PAGTARETRPPQVPLATSEGPDVLGLETLGPADGGVLDALVVLQAAVTVSLDRGLVNEDILRGVVGSDKAIALLRVEPLHCSLSHCALLLGRSSGPTACIPGCTAACPPVRRELRNAGARCQNPQALLHEHELRL